MSGYCDCSCRDCFEIAMTSDDGADALCSECKAAGCEGGNAEEECSAPHAYGGHCGDVECCGEVTVGDA